MVKNCVVMCQDLNWILFREGCISLLLVPNLLPRLEESHLFEDCNYFRWLENGYVAHDYATTTFCVPTNSASSFGSPSSRSNSITSFFFQVTIELLQSFPLWVGAGETWYITDIKPGIRTSFHNSHKWPHKHILVQSNRYIYEIAGYQTPFQEILLGKSG